MLNTYYKDQEDFINLDSDEQSLEKDRSDRNHKNIPSAILGTDAASKLAEESWSEDDNVCLSLLRTRNASDNQAESVCIEYDVLTEFTGDLQVGMVEYIIVAENEDRNETEV